MQRMKLRLCTEDEPDSELLETARKRIGSQRVASTYSCILDHQGSNQFSSRMDKHLLLETKMEPLNGFHRFV